MNAPPRTAADWLDGLLRQAVDARAADLHVEPIEPGCRIRARIDGTLLELPPPPERFAAAIVSRIKILANLDIAETRLPQDGRFGFDVDGRKVDFRVSVLPVQNAESLTLRLLDHDAERLDLFRLGFSPENLEALLRTLRHPHGLVVAVGPTGSGKSTTLNAILRHLNEPERKIVSIEDPVEYEIDGVLQLHANEPGGTGFGEALRAFLRHDPDVILIGEIRDPETARIAIQAALTGHLVLCTLHAADAASVPERFVDMGIEPYLPAATLRATFAQRLLRLRCPRCEGAGCDSCNGTGRKGRRAIFELLVVNPEIREAIAQNRPPETLRELSRKNGMRSLTEAANELRRQDLVDANEIRSALGSPHR